MLVTYKNFQTDECKSVVPASLGRVQIIKKVVFHSDDCDDKEDVITQFVSESCKPQIDQDLNEKDFKLSTLLALGSEPQKISPRSMLSSFDRVDLTMLNLSAFGNSECNFVIPERTVETTVEPTVES